MNSPYISKNSNTPSEGAVVKKTAQVNFGMCIYEEKNTLCVSGTLCPCGYGFAQCEEQLLLFHCCSLDLASLQPEVQKWVNFNLCLFLGERRAMCLCLILCTCVPAHSITGLPVTAVFHTGCSRFQGEGQDRGIYPRISGDFSLIVYLHCFPLTNAAVGVTEPLMLQAGDACGREEGNSGILLDSVKYLSSEIFTLYLLGQSQPTLGQCWLVMWTSLVCALFNTDNGKMHFLWGLFCLRNQYNDFGVISFIATPEALQKTRWGKISTWCRTQLTVRLDEIMSCWVKKPLFRCLPWLYIPTCVMYAQVPYLHFILNNLYPLVNKVSWFLLHSSSCLSRLFLIWGLICNPNWLFAT